MLGLQSRYEATCAALKVSYHPDCYRIWTESMAVTLSPIAPYSCEHVWRRVLKKDSFVEDQPWPVFEIDAIALRKSQILGEAMESFRSAKDEVTKKKGTSAPETAVIYVRTSYFDWQVTTLNVLAQVCEFGKGGNLLNIDEANAALRSNEEMSKLGKQKGVALAFGVFHIREEVARRGKLALTTELPFDEKDLYETYRTLIQSFLCVSTLDIRTTDDEDHPVDKTKGKTRPEYTTLQA